MEKQNNNKGVIILLIVIIVILLALCVLFATGTINFNSNNINDNDTNENVNNNNNKPNDKVTDNSNETNDNNSLSTICTAEVYDKLQILSMENKSEKIGAIGGSTRGYNVTTTVTKEHNYTSTPENNELYTNDYLGTLYVLYKNKLYYTSQKETISKYCITNKANGSTKLTCDYSKFNDDAIKEFNAISINVNLKAIGSYGNSGSGAPTLYALTTDGKVINLSNDYSDCGIMYDSAEYPIDRIFNIYFYDGVEYTILLKNGTLITRDVDREHPIEFEH